LSAPAPFSLLHEHDFRPEFLARAGTDARGAAVALRNRAATATRRYAQVDRAAGDGPFSPTATAQRPQLKN
jgi:hypothetical protein